MLTKPAPPPLDDAEQEESQDDETGLGDVKPNPRGPFAKQREPNRGILEAIRRCTPPSQREFARRMKVSQPTVIAWLYDNCPAERAVEVEKAMGVSRRIIRPDLFAEEPLEFSQPLPKSSDVHATRYAKIESDEEL